MPGGTNFVFGAIRGNQDVIKPISLPSNSHDLGQCLETLERGFREVINALDEKPVAISFAFPGSGRLSQRNHRRLSA